MSVEVRRPEGSAVRPPALGRPRSWVAEIAGDGTPRIVRGLPVRRDVVAARGAGRGLTLHAAGAADLPEVAVGDRCAVVFEGALEEREALRARLGDETPAEASDAELVLAAFRRWGDRTPAELRGLYALVIWDAEHERLLAIRDRMGWYPLFFADAGGELVFATSAGLVAGHPAVPGELHRAALAEALCYRFLDPRESFYAHVRRLPPGWSLSRDGGGERLGRYWDLRFGNWLDWRRDDIPGRFDETFGRAVTRCLGDGDPAIFLSGGLDSVGVAIEAARQQREAGGPPPLALSLAFPDDVDEVAIQSGVAQRLGLPQVLLPFWEAAGHERALLRVAELSAEYPAPLLNLWRPSYLRLGQEGVRRGCREILTGHGGDEWMDSGIDVAADLIHSGNLVELARLLRMARRSYRMPVHVVLRNVLWRFGARPLLVEAALALPGGLGRRAVESRKRRYIERLTPSYVAPDPELRSELDRRAMAMLPPPRSGSRYRGGVPALLDSALMILLQEDNFETSRRLGIPLRMPFFDTELIELACRVRPEDLYSGGRSKGLLRARIAPRIPGLGFDRQKKLPATSFMRSIVRQQTLPAWREVGGAPELARLGVVEPRELERHLLDLVAGRHPRAYNLGVFSLSLEMWARARR